MFGVGLLLSDIAGLAAAHYANSIKVAVSERRRVCSQNGACGRSALRKNFLSSHSWGGVSFKRSAFNYAPRNNWETKNFFSRLSQRSVAIHSSPRAPYIYELTGDGN